ncbi:hypothetical protein GCM10010377_60990 [Streptomyces viridiviolaceus]|nr:hypothetical protein GCM10010377_60990 [Streptomyces viridiviolaceus]
MSRSDVPSSRARRAARLRSSWEDSVSNRPIGTRCTAGGDDAGDMPKNRFNSSLNGSDDPKPNDDIDMAAPGAAAGLFNRNAMPTTPQVERESHADARARPPQQPGFSR